MDRFIRVLCSHPVAVAVFMQVQEWTEIIEEHVRINGAMALHWFKWTVLNHDINPSFYQEELALKHNKACSYENHM